ncbi:MAG TPA: hypothetical protein VFT18_08395, partial [Gaiellaceae bacterium]|nr:hypothetical protein [Gaiellaceae bacterium]
MARRIEQTRPRATAGEHRVELPKASNKLLQASEGEETSRLPAEPSGPSGLSNKLLLGLGGGEELAPGRLVLDQLRR